LSDTDSEGRFVWNSTGKPMSPGYIGWAPGRPYSTGDCTYSCTQYLALDCAAYSTFSALPAWTDEVCSFRNGGICELQPSSSNNTVIANRVHEL